ncbi:MAG: hypothetical protein ACI4IN_01750 [Eubacterium sp.]
MPDTNTWLIQARQILSGQVPYKDIYEHKGPLQMFAYLFAALPCFKTFEGMYITEIVLFFVFGIGVYKTSKLFGKKYNLISTIFSLLITALSTAFSTTGSSEELLLFTFIWSLYFMAKNVKSKQEFEPVSVIFIGAFCAIRLWTKYNLCFFDIVLVVYTTILYVRNKWNILKPILHYVIGFVCVTAPILIYFTVKDALYDLFYVYFYTVIFKYSSTIGIDVESELIVLLPVILLFVIFLASTVKKEKEPEDAFMLAAFASFSVFMFLSSNWWSYYLLDVFAFIVYFITKALNSNVKLFTVIFALLVPMMMLINDTQAETLKYSKSDYAQFEIAKVVNKIEDPKIYYYSAANVGFYVYSDNMPFARYFTNYNIKLNEISEERNEILSSKTADYIISFYDNSFDGYELVLKTETPLFDVWYGLGKENRRQEIYLFEKTENIK